MSCAGSPGRPRIALLTGPVGAGKTTVAERVAGLAVRRGLKCGGLLAPALLDGCGRKAGIWAADVRTGERRLLARTDRDLGGPRAGTYSFDAAALAWALAAIEHALPPAAGERRDGMCSDTLPPAEVQSDGRCSPALPPAAAGGTEGGCDLVFVDEIGKLELWHGTGLVPVLPWLAAGWARRALIIVRETLLAELQPRLGPVEAGVFYVSEQNRDALPAHVLEWLLAGS